MRQINIFEKGDKVAIEYEIDAILFKNGTLYYKLKEQKADGAIFFLPNAYTAEELIPMPMKRKEGKDATTI